MPPLEKQKSLSDDSPTALPPPQVHNQISSTDLRCRLGMAVDPHSFFADPDPAVLLNAVPDPAAFFKRIQSQLKKNCSKFPYEEFSEVEKGKNDCSKVKNHGAGPNFLTKIPIKLLPVLISMHFFCFFLKIFPSWIWIRVLNSDADPGGKMNAYPSGSRIHNPETV